MITVNILTVQTPLKRRRNDFYPCIKWKNEIKKNEISISFLGDHKSKKIFNCDVIIIDYRYFINRIKSGTESEMEPVFEFINNVKKHQIKIILFDTGDSTGSRCFQLTPYVDLHLKKQLLKNRKKYTLKEPQQGLMVWLPDSIDRKVSNYTPCPPDQLSKLKVGWNIGLTDYRKFYLSDYYPIGTSTLFNSIYKNPKYTNPSESKELVTSYRASINDDKRYSYQREIVLNTIDHIEDMRIGKGTKISKNKYLKELENSKIIISPFGWGEICYRDFEAFINGAILLKPSMAHLETYPNLYIENETYIDLDWNLSRLEQKLYDINQNYKHFKKVAVEGQNRFKKVYNDSESFVSHFKNIIMQVL